MEEEVLLKKQTEILFFGPCIVLPELISNLEFKKSSYFGLHGVLEINATAPSSNILRIAD